MMAALYGHHSDSARREGRIAAPAMIEHGHVVRVCLMARAMLEGRRWVSLSNPVCSVA
jgi:hypothetical protein